MHKSSLRTILKASGGGLGDRQVKAIVSTSSVDRMGDIVVQAGIDLTGFRKSPTVLFNHDAAHPIAKAISIGLEGGNLTAITQFPPLGASAKADEVYALIKAGIINSTSIGFRPIAYEPIDKAKPYGPQRYTRSELLEFSFVSVPANMQASITERDLATKAPRLAAARKRMARFKELSR